MSKSNKVKHIDFESEQLNRIYKEKLAKFLTETGSPNCIPAEVVTLSNAAGLLSVCQVESAIDVFVGTLNLAPDDFLYEVVCAYLMHPAKRQEMRELCDDVYIPGLRCMPTDPPHAI